MVQISGPFHVFVEKSLKPAFQFLGCFYCFEPSDLFCLQTAVGHLNRRLRQVVFRYVKPGIAHGLGQMDRIWLLHFVYIQVHALNLVNGHAGGFLYNAVGSPFYYKKKSLFLHLVSQKNLSPVGRPLLPLNLSVNSRSLLHGLLFSSCSSPIVDIAGAQHKFHQISHGNPYSRQLLLLSLIRILCLFHK